MVGVKLILLGSSTSEYTCSKSEVFNYDLVGMVKLSYNSVSSVIMMIIVRLGKCWVQIGCHFTQNSTCGLGNLETSSFVIT